MQIYSFIYHQARILELDDLGLNKPINKMVDIDSIYFSVVVHSTLGFGDITPKKKIGKLAVMSHTIMVIIGNVLFSF